MSLPTGWATMTAYVSHSHDIFVKDAGWTWSGAPEDVVGTGNTSGTGKFGYTIYRDIAGPQNLTIDEMLHYGGHVSYRIVVHSVPSTITDATIPRLLIELYCLAYASTNPIPRVGDQFFGGKFGSVSGASNLEACIATDMSFEMEDAKDPTKWILKYTIGLERRYLLTKVDADKDKQTDKNIEEAPWTLPPEVSISWSTEDFTLGLGKFIAAKTPAELGTALEDGSYAGLFNDASASHEIIMNSGRDPLESPPPMKVATATINISGAYDDESFDDRIGDAITAAIEQVADNSLNLIGVTFPAFSCKLVGGSVTQKRWKKRAEWLPKQKHPLEFTYEDIGWLPPNDGETTASDVAVNPTKNVLPAFTYLTYHEVSLSIAFRKLGWGYALVDKGYREWRDGGPKEIKDVASQQTYCRILAEGLEVDTSSGTSDKKVLRLYQVLETGSALETLLEDYVLGEEVGGTGGTA